MQRWMHVRCFLRSTYRALCVVKTRETRDLNRSGTLGPDAAHVQFVPLRARPFLL